MTNPPPKKPLPKLNKDFLVADAHMFAHQTLGAFINMATQVAQDKKIAGAIQNAPKIISRDRSFIQIVVDDAMDAFADVMEKATKSCDDFKEKVPHSFYLDLMRQRYGDDVTEAQAKIRLQEHIDHKKNFPVSPSSEADIPLFIRLIKNDCDLPLLAKVSTQWNKTIYSFARLTMPEEAIAAMDAAENTISTFSKKIQNHINEKMKSLPADSGGAPPKTGAQEEEPLKIHRAEDLQDIETEMSRLVGMDEPKELIREIEARVRHMRILKDTGLNSKKDGGGIEHFVFTGNPGTGKTTFARLIGKIYKDNGMLKKGHVVEADRADLVAGYIGQTEGKTKKVIGQALDGVLFIDEAYLLDGEGNDFGKLAMGILLKSMEMNKNNLVVVIAGYPDPMNKLIKSNPGLSRRFKYHMNYSDFTPDQLMEIFDKNIESSGRKITHEARERAKLILTTNKQAMGNHFGNAGTVENMVDLLNNKLSLLLENDGTLQKYDNLKKKNEPIPPELKLKLITITPEIVEQIKLSTEKTTTQKAVMDLKFGNNPPPPANDSNPETGMKSSAVNERKLIL
ncbi:MAG: hypothetical protein CO093_08355 [Alphaproteobacteria bacterium CG_4_9_14_3_um_filter_47_13]|nr:MAG: hypothetical protein CO093_08355 [Alphaproteobacteria bacterium CG_4_9_14_3_um_filter_47_13]